MAILHAVADIVRLDGAISICPVETLSHCYKAMDAFLTVILRHQNQSTSRHDDEDEEDYDASEDDETIMYAITRLAAALFKTYTQSALPHAQTLLQFSFKISLLRNALIIW